MQIAALINLAPKGLKRFKCAWHNYEMLTISGTEVEYSRRTGSVQMLLMTWGWFNIRMTSYQYRKFHCGDKTILRPSYIHNEISYTDKMSSLYWIGALVPTRTSAPMALTTRGNYLTHWNWDKMAAISRTIFSSTFYWIKLYEFRFRFHCWLFLKFEFTIFLH